MGEERGIWWGVRDICEWDAALVAGRLAKVVGNDDHREDAQSSRINHQSVHVHYFYAQYDSLIPFQKLFFTPHWFIREIWIRLFSVCCSG